MPDAEIFRSKKDFASRWVGHPRLNRLGLHVARMRATELMLGLRRRQIAPLGARGRARELVRDGIVVWPDPLRPAVFAEVRDEVKTIIDAVERAVPISEAEVEALGYAPVRSVPVAANTLVLADTRGFHARGAASPGARRLAIYASAPRWPFSPLAL